MLKVLLVHRVLQDLQVEQDQLVLKVIKEIQVLLEHKVLKDIKVYKVHKHTSAHLPLQVELRLVIYGGKAILVI